MSRDFLLSDMETETSKGKRCIIFDNNKFGLHYKGVHKTTWRCTTKTCKAKIYSPSGSTDILDADVTHNHEDNVRNLQYHLLRVNCKQQGKDDVQSNAETIVYKQLFNMVDRSEILHREIENTKRAINGIKRKEKKGKTFGEAARISASPIDEKSSGVSRRPLPVSIVESFVPEVCTIC